MGIRREPLIGPGAIDSVPDLVVEVLSPATRANDLGPKRREYLERTLAAEDASPGLSLIVGALFTPSR